MSLEQASGRRTDHKVRAGRAIARELQVDLALPALRTAEPGTVMLARKIKDWPNRNNTARIKLPMRHIVMTFDMINVYRLGNAVMLI